MNVTKLKKIQFINKRLTIVSSPHPLPSRQRGNGFYKLNMEHKTVKAVFIVCKRWKTSAKSNIKEKKFQICHA
jgi:hypothetical protein